MRVEATSTFLERTVRSSTRTLKCWSLKLDLSSLYLCPTGLWSDFSSCLSVHRGASSAHVYLFSPVPPKVDYVKQALLETPILRAGLKTIQIPEYFDSKNMSAWSGL